jgi:hypothetical protein
VKPIDTATGKTSGSEVFGDKMPVLVGWLATHTDGTQARLGLDRAKADKYAVTHHALIEAMFVFRKIA